MSARRWTHRSLELSASSDVAATRRPWFGASQARPSANHRTPAIALSTGAYIFPGERNNNPPTAQARVLELMIFDLSACVSSAPISPFACDSLSLNDVA